MKLSILFFKIFPNGINGDNTQQTEQIEVTPMIFAREYRLERGTVQHDLAQESLVLIDEDGDYDTFSDDGDVTLAALYVDLCAEYSKEIRKEMSKRLRG